MTGIGYPARAASEYGAEFDALAEKWRVLENEHDKQHPDRSDCGGVGNCSMMFASNRLESEMVDALDAWRAARP
jgi:hypothetical protein